MTIPASTRDTTFAFLALVLGSVAIGASPIFVRLTDVGPFASAFWRVALALPVLWGWHIWESRARDDQPSLQGWQAWKPMIPAGLLFAGDLTFWHLSILHTTVANATLFANFSAIVVAIGAWLFLGERITRMFALGLVIAIIGMGLLVGASIEIDPSHVAGDGYGMITALFFGSYVLSVRSVRSKVPAATLMFRSGVITAAALLVVTLVGGGDLWPGSASGWGILLGLALFAHAAGQGLLAYALGHVPAALSSLVILIEPLAAAILGWLILAEAITPLQGLGGVVILVGILIARHQRHEAPDDLA